MRILLVATGPGLVGAFEPALAAAGHAIDWVRPAPLSAARLGRDVGLVLVDAGAPGALAALRALRARGDATPVLVLAGRETIEARVLALDAGADGVLLAPFAAGELLARMRALARRDLRGAPPAPESPPLSNGTIALEPEARRARVGDRDVALSDRETALLQALLQRPGTVLSRDALERRLYGRGAEEGRAVDFLIHCLRRKIGARNVRNVRGVGWMVAGTPDGADVA